MPQIKNFLEDIPQIINPIVPNASFLYSLRTYESRQVVWCFQGVEKGCIWID